ncbi:MAG TPA: ribonuclease III [Candidatus Hydrogenedentes bacterium]|nr:ribonuclease III [Candidatus Hydrogenedentota bacterium]
MSVQAAREEELRALTLRLGVVINDIELLDRALTHASIMAETSGICGDYEALEFLGDAVLGLAVAHHVYHAVPDRTPGEYSRMRAAIVNERSVAKVAGALGFAPHIRLGKGEELSGGRRRAALLADCLEAFVGALYIDQGWDTARGFIEQAFGDMLDAARTSEQVWDFKSRLQNYCQARHMALPTFTVVAAEGPDHRKRFAVEVSLGGEPAGRGSGKSKKEAEQNAAREALIREGQYESQAGEMVAAGVE